MPTCSIGDLHEPLYGNFRNKKFNQIYETYESFYKDYGLFKVNGLDPKLLNENSLKTIFMLLSGYYGQSTIANASIDQFKIKLFTLVFQYAPAWEKRLDVQNKIRQLTEEEITTGSKVIYNHAYHDGTAPSTNTLEELPAINEQNTNNYKKSKLEGYASLISLINTDVTKDFVNKFKGLFLTIVEPELPLYYVTESGEEENI